MMMITISTTISIQPLEVIAALIRELRPRYAYFTANFGQSQQTELDVLPYNFKIYGGGLWSRDSLPLIPTR